MVIFSAATFLLISSMSLCFLLLMAAFYLFVAFYPDLLFLKSRGPVGLLVSVLAGCFAVLVFFSFFFCVVLYHFFFTVLGFGSVLSVLLLLRVGLCSPNSEVNFEKIR